jgi:hypothetical protein
MTISLMQCRLRFLNALLPLFVLMSDGNNQSAVVFWPSVRTQAGRATQATLPVTRTVS